MTDTYAGHDYPLTPQDLDGPGRPMGLPDVPFGPREDDRMPFTWAERGLTWLKENRPMVFADMMLAVVGIGATAKEKR